MIHMTSIERLKACEEVADAALERCAELEFSYEGQHGGCSCRYDAFTGYHEAECPFIRPRVEVSGES